MIPVMMRFWMPHGAGSAGSFSNIDWGGVEFILEADSNDEDPSVVDVTQQAAFVSSGVLQDESVSQSGLSSYNFPNGTTESIYSVWNPACVGTTDFTLEYYFKKDSGGFDGMFGFYYNANNLLKVDVDSGNVRITQIVSGSSTSETGSAVSSSSDWIHVCIVRYGGTIYVYHDAVLKASMTCDILIDINYKLCIGNVNSGASQAMHGWIDNVRFTAEAVYTAAGFTLPTVPYTRPDPLTITANDVLMRLDGTSFMSKGIRYPFALSATFTTATEVDAKHGGRSFDTTAQTNSSMSKEDVKLNPFTAGTFTFEGWFKPTLTGQSGISGVVYFAPYTGTACHRVYFDFSTSKWTVLVTDASDSDDVYATSGTYDWDNDLIDTWIHVAYIYTIGNTTGAVRLYIDGTEVISETNIYLPANANGSIRVSGEASSDTAWRGLSDEISWYSIEKYTSSFTPPTKAERHLDGAEKRILIGCDNDLSDLYENTVSEGGTPSFSDSVVKYHTYSWDVTNSSGAYYVELPSDTAPNKEAFQFECWFYPTSMPGSGTYAYLFHLTDDSGTNIANARFGNNVQFFIDFNFNVAQGFSRFTSSTLPTVNAWNHFALVRHQGNWQCWLNGAYINNTTFLAAGGNDIAVAYPTRLYIGGAYGGASKLSGYMSDIRLIVRGNLHSPRANTVTVPTGALTL